MTVGVATCSPDTPISQIAGLLLEKNLEALVVLERSEGHALGVVGQEELAGAFAHPDAARLVAEDVMRDGVPQIPPDIPLVAAAQIMRDQGVRILFIMHHSGGIEYPAAYIAYNHLLRYLVACPDGELHPERLQDLGIQAERMSPLEVFLLRREAARQKNQLKK